MNGQRTLSVILLCAGLALGASGDPGLLPVPRPVTDKLAKGDQQQLREQRALLDELLERKDVPSIDLAEAFGGAGQIYYLYDFMDAAEACLLNSRSLAPDDFRWHYYLGALYAREGELEKAAESLRRATEIRPRDLAALLRYANVLLDSNQGEASEQSYRKALELDPKSAAAHYGLGRIAYSRGDFPAAIERFETAVELQPEANSIHHLLGLAYREIGDLEKARSHLALNRHDPVTFTDPLIDSLGQLYKSARYHLKLGNQAVRSGALELAIREYRKAAEIDPQDALILYNLGWALHRSGHGEEAIRYFRAAVEIDPEYRNAHYNLAVLLATAGRYEEAAAHYQRAVEIDPEDYRAHIELAVALSGAGYLNRATQELEQLIEVLPQHESGIELRANAYFLLGGLQERKGDDRGAVQSYEAAVRLRPQLKEGHQRLAAVLTRQGELGAAASAFARVIEIAPTDLDAHLGQARMLTLAGEYARARQALETSLRTLPDSLAVQHFLARLLAACPDASVRDGSRALELALSVFRSQSTLEHAETVAMALAEVGRFDEAAEVQRRVLREASNLGSPVMNDGIQRRLDLYEAQVPCRAPWQDETL